MMEAMKMCVLLQLLLTEMIICRSIDNGITTPANSSVATALEIFATNTAHTIGICEEFGMVMGNDAAFQPYIGDVTVILRLS